EIKAAVGQAVDASIVLGITGSTGFSTGEHLHFEIRWKDTPVNPEDSLEFHIPPGTPLSNGPLYFPSAATATASSSSPSSGPPPHATNTPTPTTTRTITPPPTITPTPTKTPTPTPKPPTPTRTPTPAPKAVF